MAEVDIENNFITGNGDPTMTAYGGILVDQISGNIHVLSFNTISDNESVTGNPAGVSCTSQIQDLTASDNIIYGNLSSATGTQVGRPHCLWTYSDIAGSVISPARAPA